MRSAQQSGARGSLKWMQRAVEERWADLEDQLLSQLSGASSINWLSPLAGDDFAEYRDAAFLRLIGHEELVGELGKFWPKRGPQWDGLARTDAGHILLCEAKAHIAEFCSPPSQASAASLLMISSALLMTARKLGVKEAHFLDWGRHFYQYSNRLAHLLWLRENHIDAKLVLIGFVHDHDMPGHTTVEAWEAAYLLADRVLGIPARHCLSSHVIHVHPEVRG